MLTLYSFGGSTSCLIFRKGVDVEFEQDVKPGREVNVAINSKIATVKNKA